MAKELEQRSVAAARKADRAIDAAKAMREYEAERIRIDANTARLRKLRLAKEAADAATERPAAKAKTAGRAKAPAKR